MELYGYISGRNDAGVRHRRGNRDILADMLLCRGLSAVFSILGHGGGAHSCNDHCCFKGGHLLQSQNSMLCEVSTLIKGEEGCKVLALAFTQGS